MFLTIEKNGHQLEIPEGAYKSYASSGWSKVGTDERDVKAVEKDEWDEVDEELNEKPIDEMDMEELKKKAKELKIDTSNLKTVGALRKAVKTATNK